MCIYGIIVQLRLNRTRATSYDEYERQHVKTRNHDCTLHTLIRTKFTEPLPESNSHQTHPATGTKGTNQPRQQRRKPARGRRRYAFRARQTKPEPRIVAGSVLQRCKRWRREQRGWWWYSSSARTAGAADLATAPCSAPCLCCWPSPSPLARKQTSNGRTQGLSRNARARKLTHSERASLMSPQRRSSAIKPRPERSGSDGYRGSRISSRVWARSCDQGMVFELMIHWMIV